MKKNRNYQQFLILANRTALRSLFCSGLKRGGMARDRPVINSISIVPLLPGVGRSDL